MKRWGCKFREDIFCDIFIYFTLAVLGTPQAGISKLTVLRCFASKILLLAKLWVSQQLACRRDLQEV
jgi:hypothetical protein